MKTYTTDELIKFNEMLLGRGMPSDRDGIGYNKADYGACATYYYGLSDAQYADLAKRLIKYSETQLNVSKEVMKMTASKLCENIACNDRSKGISLKIMNEATLISFRYNEKFIKVIREQPKRRFDKDSKGWIIPNSNLISTLEALKIVGADVENAIKYANQNGIYRKG